MTYLFNWSRNEIEITVGDSITWDWGELELTTTRIEVELNEIEPPQFDSHDITLKYGGISNAGTSSETFTVTFSNTGSFYFVTRNNFNEDEIVSVVYVGEPTTAQVEVEVRVGGFLAEYRPSAPELVKRQAMLMDDTLNFEYSLYFTPIVVSVEPQFGAVSATLYTIMGERFSTNVNSSVVEVGNFPCVVETATDTAVTCRLVNNGDGLFNPPPFTPLSVSLTNTDPGFGNAYILTPMNSTVTLHPFIREIYPSEGSIAGGTDIIIYGETFEEYFSVLLGDARCMVTSIEYSEIHCTTFPQEASFSSVRFFYEGNEIAILCDACNFSYSEDHTPEVESVYPSTIREAGSTIIYIYGNGFSHVASDNVIYIGDYPCPVIMSNESLLSCELQPLPAGTYSLSLKICNLTDDRCYGNADITNDAQTITVEAMVTGVSPYSGSTEGGTSITLTGYGLNSNSPITVTIGDSNCEVRSISHDKILCVTGANSAGNFTIEVRDGTSSIPVDSNVMFESTEESTPTVDGIIPSSGGSGEVIMLSGSLFGNNADNLSVSIGDEPCIIQELINETHLTCWLGVNFAGKQNIMVNIDGVGNAIVAEGVSFTYNLVVSSLSNISGSIAGQNILQLIGSGFDPSDTTITICDRLCLATATVPSATEIECVVPPAADDLNSVTEDVICDVIISSVGMSVTYDGNYTYRLIQTPRVTSVNDTRGGTEGGTPLTIMGSGFGEEGAMVTIAGSPCTVQSQSDVRIECVTNRSGRTVRAKVKVNIEGKGFAVSDVEFWYVDLWSSTFTWGGGPLPREGDFVVIPRGQTLVLDTKTNILAFLLIQGGELIFDREKGDNEVELHTQGALITSGGRLEVGTEEEPFTSKTQIVLYGHVLSTEIPVYGAKTLALREGEIDLHGRPLNVTWTRLALTANAGDYQLHLQDFVEWEVGGKIVIASTSFSQRENEEKVIESVTPGSVGSILTLTTPLEYEHISVRQTIDGRMIETSGEVGYLTRNIVVRGNINEEWVEDVEACPEEFRPGQFQVQTCFQGRFGAETISDQFGSQIMIHAPEQNQGLVIGRIEYVEVTHAGQAFRLGRYPIHFHLNGNVSGSYVRGCGIHHTFNRAITIHAVDHLLVEKNVAYNILGHAYFLEDGNEQFNIIQDNLGVFVRASSSLLNVDITPATFWVVNANNILRRNAAAGGTHFGFWYRLPANPTGPSFTTSLCPRKQRVLQFSNNTAHSFGWYGLWVFRQYFPSPSGECSDNGHAPSYFDSFLAWRNDRGVEFAEIGALQLRDSIMLDNKLAGVEITEIESIWSEESGPLIANTLIVGHSEISSNDFCTNSGIKTPKSYYLTVSGVTFANFDRKGCYPIQACSHCKSMQGGFETRYRNIKFLNAGDKLTKWQWEHEHIHRDLDGTLTNSTSPKLLIPDSQLLDPVGCRGHSGSSDGGNTNGTRGAICDGELEFGRFAVSNPLPSSLRFTTLVIANTNGNTTLPYVLKRLRNTGPGYMVLLELNKTYDVIWLEGRTFTNISYMSKISGFSPNDYIILSQQYSLPLDVANVAGVVGASNASVLDDPSTAMTGDYFIDENNTLSYIIKGGIFPLNEQSNVFRTYRCFYLNCIPPPPPTLPPPIPPGRPNEVMMWSNVTIWPNNTLPTEGDNVTIPRDMYVIVDVPMLPRLGMIMIQGGLEMLDNQSRTLEADLIIIEGGRFVAGYPDTPFRNNFRIILHGSNTSPEFRYEFGAPTVGAKAIGVFGELILNAEPTSSTSWSLLRNTANVGDTQITLMDNVDWNTGDLIVVTSTSFDAFETEVFEISSVAQNVLILNDSIKYTHSVFDDNTGEVCYSIRPEVGRLSRKIVIENGDPETANNQAFGCRVLVSSIDDYRGTIQLQGVEFKGCGQLGFTDDFDPRFSLAMVNTGRQTESYIRECSFHDGYNTGIGIFGTDNMEIRDNVIHSTVGPSMIITGSSHLITRNLASLSQFIGTYRTRDEPLNSLWTANYKILDASGITFIYNHAAGGAKSGIHTRGEECIDSSSTIRHNVVHSSLHCIHTGYRDGNPTGCARFDNFTIYSCYHYGLFSYSGAGIQLFNSTFVNNKVAVYVSVIGPSPLSHELSTKSVLIEKTNIISGFNCDQDNKRPAIADHRTSHSGLQTPTGGHTGIIIPSFTSGSGGFPKFSWPTFHNYPTISGLTSIKEVSFVNFGNRCPSKNDTVIMTNRFSEDANHPVYLERIVFENCNDEGPIILPEHKVFIHEPNIGRINPSDCVDMDCDGLKHVLIKDLDGSFTENNSSRTLVGLAELGWDGPDRRRGIGDFRIPKTMLTNEDGSRISTDKIYPEKGILRGKTFGSDECMYNQHWNLYECANLDHLMIVLESLDEDTEVRRLSPIGIGANGFIDLLNGPMDNGWCGGYTCQERVSTFYGIVASQFIYTIGLTSTNPQNFAIHLLNSEDNQTIVLRVIYTTSQRLDVYVTRNNEDEYVPPKNAMLQPDGNLVYMDFMDQFYPTLNDPHGANYYDRSLKQLHVTIRGSNTYKIITTPVIMLSLTITVTTEDFFAEEFLVRNLALLLNIPSNRIRVVDVVRESKRRKRQAGGGEETIALEIGDPPTAVIINTPDSVNATNNDTYSMMNTTDTVDTANTTDRLNFERLTELTEMVATIVQTGDLLRGSNGTTLVSAEIEEPPPPPVDPTGGVRATPSTGGPQPEDVGNDTSILTFFMQQQINEERANVSGQPIALSIPSTLVITRQPTPNGIIEGVPLSYEMAPLLTMMDNNGRVSENLGIGTPWQLTAVVSSGPAEGFVTNSTVEFVNGLANFEGLVFSHPGTYTLSFIVTLPMTASFSISSQTLTVQSRSLELEIYQQPQNGNTTFALYPYPRVRLFDITMGSRIHLRDEILRNSSWYIVAHISKGNFVRSWRSELVRGEAIFTDIRIPITGDFSITFEALTTPQSGNLPASTTSQSFTITSPQFTRFIVTYDVDFNSIVAAGDESRFIKAFEERFISQYSGAELFNTTISNGSVIVSTFVTAKRTSELIKIINQATSDPNTTLSFQFNNMTLIPLSLVQDPAYPVFEEEEDEYLILILASAIPAGTILFCGILLICVVMVCQRRRKSLKYQMKVCEKPYSYYIILLGQNNPEIIFLYFNHSRNFCFATKFFK